MTQCCPCGTEVHYNNCCGPLIDSGVSAQTPEQLMRSRYVAYQNSNYDYLIRTWHDSTRPIELDSGKIQWIRLRIHSASQIDDNMGTVDFTASFIDRNIISSLHEISRFVKEGGVWFYMDGKQLPTETRKLGRNEYCPCGSGNKYKKCCEKKYNQ